jgi:hypothetical protein
MSRNGRLKLILVIHMNQSYRTLPTQVGDSARPKKKAGHIITCLEAESSINAVIERVQYEKRGGRPHVMAAILPRRKAQRTRIPEI